MSENSSDSEGSSGWTIINNEGSDIETLGSENGGTENDQTILEAAPTQEEEEQSDEPLELSAEGSAITVSSVEANPYPVISEEVESVPEVQEEKVAGENSANASATGDDSDIITLESPVVEEIGRKDAEASAEEVLSNEEYNLGSSSSSQYTFSTPKIAFASQLRADESSSDETSDQSGSLLRRRRARSNIESSTETEERPPAEHEIQQQRQQRGQFSSTLNKCILIALVVAISMGFGHFYGTTQIQERQKLVEKNHENELNDMKDDLFQCQKEQEVIDGSKSQAEDLTARLKQTEVEKLSLESQQQNIMLNNHQLKNSLEVEERALSSLQEELRKLREQIRNLEDKGTGTESIITENQKLKDHLEEEKQRIRSFLNQKETLVAEAQMLRRELDKERRVTQDLKEKLEQLSNTQLLDDTEKNEEPRANHETEELRARLMELERKLTFEQHRSDLWEKLYLEAKEQTEAPETKKPREKNGKGKKSKETLFSSVQDTFDAVKNSTKEFVKHQKEKIKQAKEAVKENLKKFTDSVKSTFRHFKDSTRNLFDKNRDKKSDQKRHEAKKAKTDCHENGDCTHKTGKHHEAYKQKDSWQFRHRKAPFMQAQFKETEKHESNDFQTFEQNWKCSPGHACNKQHDADARSLKGCSGVFECARQESMSLFNKALDPIRADEFNQLLQSYVMQEVDDFHHWAELQKFISRFFHNGIFIHDQMLFTDFVNDVEDYLEEMKEYQKGSHDVFEDLDEYVYRHFFGEAYGTSRPYRRPSSKNREGPRHRKHKWKHQTQTPYKKEGKWNKQGRHGRQMANVEIKLGPMPFDPRY